jgi:hypothetical protein
LKNTENKPKIDWHFYEEYDIENQAKVLKTIDIFQPDEKSTRQDKLMKFWLSKGTPKKTSNNNNY